MRYAAAGTATTAAKFDQSLVDAQPGWADNINLLAIGMQCSGKIVAGVAVKRACRTGGQRDGFDRRASRCPL